MAKRPGVGEVLRAFGPAFVATHPLSPLQMRVWRAMVSCRTAALGGHRERCNHCGVTRAVYHSCRNRHCPLCQTRAKEAWLAARQRELLPVPYFHVVFTLPHALHPVIARHTRLLYELLFTSAAATLTDFAANPRWLGGTPAFTLVLHTWKQDLARHVHVHALVAGGALTPAGVWVRPRRGFLFPVQALSKVFRGKFLHALARARTQANLSKDERLTPTFWRDLTTQLYRHNWVVYAKEPLGGPAEVLGYLARYTHRVAISNDRLLGVQDDRVRLRVRDATRPKGRGVITLPIEVFLARFFMHVLPHGFKRIRHYGLLAPAIKKHQLALARQALQLPAPAPAVIESVEAFLQRVGRMEWLCCRHCGSGRFVFLEAIVPTPAPLPLARAPP